MMPGRPSMPGTRSMNRCHQWWMDMKGNWFEDKGGDLFFLGGRFESFYLCIFSDFGLEYL